MDDDIRELNAAHYQTLIARGEAQIPVSVKDVEESWAGWPRRKPGTGPKPDVDDYEPDEYTGDWPDDHKLDDPRRGQAKWINGR